MDIAQEKNGSALNQTLLACGVLSSAYYAAITLLVPLLDPDYDWVDQTISELSAIGAPTRAVWVPLGVAWTILVALFGIGIIRTAQSDRRLKRMGWMIAGYAILNAYWPPMHQRATIAAGQGTATDILHLVWGGFALAFMLTMMLLGARTFGRSFRRYTYATILLFFVFGYLTGRVSPGINAGEPTPFLGIWERINIALYMAWVGVLSVGLLRRSTGSGSLATHSETPTDQ